MIRGRGRTNWKRRWGSRIEKFEKHSPLWQKSFFSNCWASSAMQNLTRLKSAENFEKLRSLSKDWLFLELQGKIWLNFDSYSDFGLIWVQKQWFFRFWKSWKNFRRLLRNSEEYFEKNIAEHEAPNFESFRKFFLRNAIKHELLGDIKLKKSLGRQKSLMLMVVFAIWIPIIAQIESFYIIFT